MLKKSTLLLSSAMLLFCSSFAQPLPYTLSVSKQVYTPLTSGTEFKPGHIWNDTDIFIAATPFNFKMDTINCHTLFSEGATSIENDTNTAISSGLLFFEGALEDRGMLTGSTSLSPVRYEITGPVGSRIFKMEVSNAGFQNERTGFGTMNDSVNIQVWIYEGSNILELRYGPSKISHGTNYFDLGSGPLIAYAKDVDVNGTGTMYVLIDDPNNPGIDTLHLVNGNPDNTMNPLTDWPSDSTVYRFTPKTNVVFQPEKLNAKVYPTLCSDQLNIELANNNATTYSIVAINGMTTNINGTIKNGKASIDVSTLPAGMYLVQMRNDSSTEVYKFTKL